MIKHLQLPGCAYFITTRLTDKLSIFTDEQCCKILLNDLYFYRKELEYLIYGYVIMPDHFHWIVHPSAKADIPSIMNKVKGHSSFEINKYLSRTGQLWQKSYHDHIIRNGLDFEEKINYIHKNPYKAGLVEDLKNYKYSSFQNYHLGDESLIKIDIPNYSINSR